MDGLTPLMITGIFIIITICYIRSLIKPKNEKQQDPIIRESHYIYKLARLAKMSEYEVFKKTAEDWPVSQAMIEKDFSKYLDSQTAPYYVNHFIRENKKHLDELKMPYYWQ